jgi:hypothetical protein
MNLIPLALIALIPLLAILEPKLRLLFRAWVDYESSRGTFHKKLLRDLLSTLRARSNELKIQKTALEIRMSQLDSELRNALKARLINHLVSEGLTVVTGIGPILKERIMKFCFDGTLESLENLPYLRSRGWRLQGIGEEKARAISRWAEKIKKRLPELLEEDFPGKSELIKKYSMLSSPIKSKINDLEAKLSFIRYLEKKASAELDRLSSTNAFTFFKAYFGDMESSRKANEHLMGIFPEWEEMPDWLKLLMKECGQRS